jgi:taurine dioxygenase
MIETVHDPKSLGLQVTPCTVNIGAEITGIDLRETLDQNIVECLTELLVEHNVIFFRDQDLTDTQHVAFARHFGELEVHPFLVHLTRETYPEMLPLNNDRERPPAINHWHTDVSWLPNPSLGAILRSITVPPVGGDTMFANMEAAYNGLPDETKERIDGLTARHDWRNFRKGMREKRGVSEEQIAEFERQYPTPHHPVVRTHPVSGRKSIYVNSLFTESIDGLDEDASESLLRQLCATATQPEVQCRFRWCPNTIAFWDNRSTQHYALADFWPEERYMERVSIVGDIPV